jgi:hypothetical protein
MAALRYSATRAILCAVAHLAATQVRGASTFDEPLVDGGSTDPNSATSVLSHERAMRCLTEAIYYEAGSEPVSGQQAVAQVVLNRVRHPAFPKSVCGVVFDGAWRTTGCQFTFTCDGSLFRSPAAAKWAQARSVAALALGGYVDDQVGASTHYHASWMTPYWSPSMVETARIGGHVFYQMPGARGAPAMLTAAYAGIEPDPGLLSPTTPVAGAPRRRALRPNRHSSSPPPPSRPATFSVWGLDIATVVPKAGSLMVHTDRSDPSL